VGTIADNFQTNLRPGSKIEISLSPEVGQISADIVHLTNIFHNLIDNALKYAGEFPQLRIETQRTQDYIKILFSDNGPGIAPRYQKRIFQKFFRVPSGNIHDVKGFGLGLYYVKIICRAHKWSIRIDSKPNTGSTFIIEIPAK
jgi:two-component system, OmpR family, phosphate regulon sensor histidine kinase PhoR